MNLRILGLYCSLQFAFGQFTTEFKLNENCRDFIPPSSYPMARRNENVVEKHHGVTVKYILLSLLMNFKKTTYKFKTF